MRRRYDLAVIGGGTGGLVSAQIAAALGARVALVERDRTGGDCLWSGCVPSKSLIAAAALAHRMRNAQTVGLAPADPVIDFPKVIGHVRRSIARIEPRDSPARLRTAGIEVIEAHGRFTAPGVLDAGGKTLRWRAAIIASGSEPALPAVTGLDTIDALTTDTVWTLSELPRRLLVLGGGPTGCELGQAFARLGSKVTIVEATDRLLHEDEPQASALVATRLTAEGVDIRVGRRVIEVTGQQELLLESRRGLETVSFDRVLIATGRRPRTDNLGLQTVGVAVADNGAVKVDGRLRTSNRRIFAVGDATGLLPTTHAAAHHARIATPNALFHTRATVAKHLPTVTFTDPELARIGLTEAQARVRWGEKTRIAEFDYSLLDRAITAGDAYGFAKLIGDPRRRLIGATVVAPGAGETIAELSAWITRHATIGTISRTVHAYPTRSEGPARAADQHLAVRYETPHMRLATRTIMAALRTLER